MNINFPKWWDNINAKMLDDMINFEPTFQSMLLNAVVALIMMDVLVSFMTMFRLGFTSKIIMWCLDIIQIIKRNKK